jgi:hypothetical protein
MDATSSDIGLVGGPSDIGLNYKKGYPEMGLMIRKVEPLDCEGAIAGETGSRNTCMRVS